jgi:hypothetical protein
VAEPSFADLAVGTDSGVFHAGDDPRHRLNPPGRRPSRHHYNEEVIAKLPSPY